MGNVPTNCIQDALRAITLMKKCAHGACGGYRSHSYVSPRGSMPFRHRYLSPTRPPFVSSNSDHSGCFVWFGQEKLLYEHPSPFAILVILVGPFGSMQGGMIWRHFNVLSSRFDDKQSTPFLHYWPAITPRHVCRHSPPQVLASIIYTASVLHSAVNFPQRSIMSFIPSCPSSMFVPIPTDKVGVKHRKSTQLY